MSLFPSLTVVVPTYNRAAVLAKALAGYLSQSSPTVIHELIIVDDGSTDRTESVVREFGDRAKFPIRYLRQPNRGPAAARNLGIREASSPLLLFTDSDVVPSNNLVQQHLEHHNLNPEIYRAVLGYVTWSPEVNPTPFMRWYGEHAIFQFKRLRGKRTAGAENFYTCNISLKTQFLRDQGQFDEDFKTAAYEDVELGFRLARKGMQLLYKPEAVAYHFQFFSFEDARRKALGNAAARQLFLSKEAGQQLFPETRRSFQRSFAKKLAAPLKRFLRPIRWLLDTRLPLPDFVYSLVFRDAIGRQSRSEIEDAQTNEKPKFITKKASAIRPAGPTSERT